MTEGRRYSKEWRVAFHEAGHAVANVLFGREFGRATVIPNEATGTLGGVDSHKPDILEAYQWNLVGKGSAPVDWGRRKEADRELFCLLAGSAVEYLLTGEHVHEGSSNDLKNAEALSKVNYPLDDRTAFVSDQAWLSYREWAYQHMIHTLGQWVVWEQVAAVAKALKSRRTLSYDEVRRLMDDAKRSATPS
jgi:ATP-dependent Zn protease